MKKRVEVRYLGRVQGVGFRFTVERLAAAYHLTGYVKNLADGGVEVVAEGEEKVIKDFLGGIRQELDYYISNYSINWFDPTGEFKNFSIRF